jgi:GT2 family glycosyltransferase
LRAVATGRAWEVVIVDNGSTDGTGDYLASLDRTQPKGVPVTAALERKRGLAAARNKGWRIARGEIVAFTDDDCYVSPDYVDSVLQLFENDPAIGFVSGRVLPFDPLDYHITFQESPQRREFRPRVFIAGGAVAGANMAFRRTLLERIGGFDERLGAGTPFPCEDIDAAAAALWSGASGAYDPRAVVYHHHGRRTEREAQALRRSYDAGRGAYYAKYILREDSRPEYLAAWRRSIEDECVEARRRGRLPRQSLREIASGVRWALGQGVRNLLPLVRWLYAHQWGRPKVGRDAVTMGDGDNMQLGAGWYECEEWPPCIRWSRPEAVVFLQTPTKAHTSLTIRAFGGAATSGKVVFPGGWSAPFAMEAGGPWEFSVPLPAAAHHGGKGLMEVRLVVDHPFVPGKDGQGDTRELGIAVERLWLQ